MPCRPPSPARHPPGCHWVRVVLALAVGLGLLAAGLSCTATWDRGSAPVAGAPPGSLQVQPPTILVTVGETAQFVSVLPAGGRILWAVHPPAAGSIDAEGRFQPSGSLGQCLVVATWSQDIRVTGSAQVVVVAAAQPATSSADLAQAAGVEQSGAGGTLVNDPILGEGLAAAATAVAAGGTIQVRHGFYPGPTTAGP